MYDVQKVRADFPILNVEAHPGVPLVYLDSAASSQKPLAVIEAMNNYYRTYNANIHRGIHQLSEAATEAYEAARGRIAAFIKAPTAEQVIYTRNATEAINLVAYSWGGANLKAGDEILITAMEHHANIVPWQMVAERTGAVVRVLPVTADGFLDMGQLPELLTEKTKMFAFMAVSNVLGTINPVEELVAAAKRVGALTLVDGAQAVPHQGVDVVGWDCDFMAFSSHKMCGPTGVGILYGKRPLLDEMPPFLGGGDMIRRVTFGGSTWNDLPYKFEAGTPSIAEGIGLGAAVDYLTELGMDNVHAHEQKITAYALEALSEVDGLRVVGPQQASQRAGLAAFTLKGVHPHDIAHILDEDGVAVRAGHHCAMPLHKECLGIPATARASFYVHTTTAEIDQLVKSLHRAQRIFRI
ncbi:MAG TPA: cysteine desulfurase [Anaerolineae bacterium]|nr:cysteine desulfurase [Anaerolineae bacterium]